MSATFATFFSILVAFHIWGHFAACAYCPNGCTTLVSGPHGVPDSALAASSSFNNYHGAQRARLNTTLQLPYQGAWCSKNKAQGEWIQVKFSQPKDVYAVQTQGRNRDSTYVKTYKVSYSDDCNLFTYYQENGVEKVFQGNADRDTIVTNALKTPLRVRCMRIVALTCMGHPCLRFEVLGTKGCPSGFKLHQGPHQGYCYSVIQEKASWTDAASLCTQLGGKLASVSRRTMQNAIQTFILHQDTYYTTYVDKNCDGIDLGHYAGLSETQCYYKCVNESRCLAFVTKSATSECWLNFKCENMDATNSSQGMDVHVLEIRTQDVWINLNRLADQHKWMVSPGVTGEYFSWGQGEPKARHIEKCAAMSPRHYYKWISKPCGEHAFFICEA